MNIKTRLKALQRSAHRRNIAVNLNLEIYANPLSLGCMYCGSNLYESTGYGLDRIDNSKGYSLDNVTPCCGTCNRAKGNMSVPDFITWIKKANSFIDAKIKEVSEMKISEREVRKSSNILENRSKCRDSETLVVEGLRK